VSRFVQNALDILESAKASQRIGHTPSEVTILIGAEGGIRIVSDSDWPLDSLAAHHGASMAYRVTPETAGVRVEGRAAGQSCVLESQKPADQFKRLLLAPVPNLQLAALAHSYHA